MKNSILLVDDKEENLFAVEQMLDNESYDFYKALNGNDALKIAFKENISLILLDVQMPGMDGFETAELLKSNEKTNKIPIVFVTAINKESQYILKGLEDGAVDYLFKPLDVGVTRAKVSTWIKFYNQQKELEEINRKMKELNEQKNHFMGMAAHDLRNPLGNISMLSDFLRRELAGKITEEQLEYIDLIKSTSEFMRGLLSDLLDITKIEAGKMTLRKEKKDIIKLIGYNVNMNQMLAEKKDIRVDFKPDGNIPEVHVDARKIDQVMNNLVSNAIKFSFPDTTVTVTVKLKGEFIEVAVSDQGQGIRESELHKLFKPFSRTSTTATGGEMTTGLGLVIVRKIVEEHGGEIKVNSEPGKGSVFTFTIPVNSQPLKENA